MDAAGPDLQSSSSPAPPATAAAAAGSDLLHLAPPPASTTGRRSPKVSSSNCKELNNASAAADDQAGSVRKDREEWSESAISTLIDAYTAKYGQLNGKGLRSKDWAEVVEIVNSNQKSAKTVEHCRNKMDTLTKRYKSEKKNKMQGGDSSWPWYDKMEIIRGCSPGKSVVTPPSSAAKPIAAPQLGSATKVDKMGRAKRGKKSATAQSLDPAPPPPLPVVAPEKMMMMTTTTNKETSGSSGTFQLKLQAAAPLIFAHQGSAIPAWHNSSPSVAATVAAVGHNVIPQVAAAAAAARVVCEQQVSNNNTGGSGDVNQVMSDGLAKSIGELATSLKAATGNLASSINGFTEVYARVEIAKMEMLKELELKRMQMQMDTAEILRDTSTAAAAAAAGDKRKRESSSSDPE